MASFWGSNASEQPTVSDGNRWARIPGVFAQRIEVTDLRAVLAKHLDVEEGTRGLLFQSGKYVGDLEPGRHTLQTATERLKGLVFGSPVSAVVVDASQHRFTIETAPLLCRDNQDVQAQVTAVVELTDPLAFFVNLLKGANQLTIPDVAQWFQPAFSSVISTLIRQSSLADFAHPEELGERLEDDLQQRLKPQLDAAGFQFVRLDLVSFQTPAYEELGRARGRLSLAEAQEDLRRQQRELDRQLERESTRDRLAQIDSEAEFREFVQRTQFQQKETDLARQQQWLKLYHDFELLKGNLEAQRQLVQRTRQLEDDRELADLQYDYDVKSLRHQQDLDRSQLDHQLNLARRRRDDQLSEAMQAFEADLQQRLGQARTDAELQNLDRETKNRDAAARLQRQQARADFALGLQAQVQQQELAGKSGELDLELRRQSSEHTLGESSKDSEHRRELERLRLLNESRTETLIAVSGDSQAAHLAELLKLGAYQGLSAEQILAVQSAQSPAVAQALAEKFRAEAAAAQTGNAASQQSLADAKLDAQQTLAQFQDFARTALETQRDTSVAAATGRPVTVIQPPVVATQTTVFCQQCGKLMDVSHAFCGSCGKPRISG